ncbi:cupredoxin domain-containing protein [Neisseriaceae bacterium JH1-16]|nr:cupredoxin domain-containing protein [Neisseriaceae bacterium JH1-16]
MSRLTLLVLAAATAAVALCALGGEASYRASPDSDGVQRIAIVGGSYYFQPDHIVVRANQPVELSVRVGSGLIPHGFVLEAPDGRKVAELKLGATAQTVSFTPKRAGRYPFYCPNRLLFFKSHREEGMSGYLDVVE